MATSGPQHAAARRGWTPGRVITLVLGCLLGLVSLASLAAGGAALWADQTQRDSSGFLTVINQAYSTNTYALTTRSVEVQGTSYDYVPSGVIDRIRIQATAADPRTPIFVGLAPSHAVHSYLAGVNRSVVTDLANPRYQNLAGSAPLTEPAAQGFWIRSASGTGTQTITWKVAPGSWTAVIMNPDGHRGIGAYAALSATAPDLVWIAVALLVFGGVVLIAAVVLIVLPIRRAANPPGPLPQATPTSLTRV